MDNLDIFLSVGTTFTQEQEDFVRAVEERLRVEGMTPHTVGRNTFTSDAPLKAVTELIQKCKGTVVIALERVFIDSGVEKRASNNQTVLKKVKLPTPWNQIEAAMAYSKGHPLMVIVEEGVKNEGLLERGNDWYVQTVKPEKGLLNSNEFNGVLSDWKEKVLEAPKNTLIKESVINPTQLTLGEILKALKPKELWGIFVFIGSLLAGAFALGAKLLGS